MPMRRHDDTVMDRDGTPLREGGPEPEDQATAEERTASESAGEPTYEEIAVRAYAIYSLRGAIDGQDLEDWLQAERELREERGRR